jgi:hypothetical protein
MTEKKQSEKQRIAAADGALGHVLQHFNEHPCEVSLGHVEDGAKMIIAFMELAHSMPDEVFKEGNDLGESISKLLEGHSMGAVIQALRPLLAVTVEDLRDHDNLDEAMKESFAWKQ